MYHRYVDDTFSITTTVESSSNLLCCLNELHQSLEFTSEDEKDGRLPFMDVMVLKNDCEPNSENKNISISTTVYRKPTFTGHYLKWKSFTSRRHKINLVKCLAERAKRICTHDQLQKEMAIIAEIFQGNGYPTAVVDRTIRQVMHPRPRLTEGPKPRPVYVRVPWRGDGISERVEMKVRDTTHKAYPVCQTLVIFTSKPMFPKCCKDILPTHQQSNMIYLFSCRCGRRYVGKTTQRLETRAKQHVPASLLRPTKEDENDDKDKDEDGTEPKTKTKTKSSTSSIGQHLLDNVECLESYHLSMFQIVRRPRCESILHILKPLYSKLMKPDLCKQLQLVRTLSLFASQYDLNGVFSWEL